MQPRSLGVELDPDVPVVPAPWPALFALVALGGALGSLARYGLAVAWPGLTTTLAVNVVGSFGLGLLIGLRPEGKWSRPFLGAGVLGGFTTFSTFAAQTVDASLPAGIAYVAGTLVLGIGAAAVGMRSFGFLLREVR